MSGDGRYVALISQGRLVSADTNDLRDVYVLDRATGSVALESLAPDGRASTEDGDHPALSHDGRFLVYESGDRIVWRDRVDAVTTTLAAGRGPVISTDGRSVAFTSADGLMLFDVATHTMQNASVDLDGRSVPNASGTPSLSGDGRRSADVFLRNLVNGSIELVSRNARGEAGNGASGRPAVSVDGRFVAFQSEAARRSTRQAAWWRFRRATR